MLRASRNQNKVIVDLFWFQTNATIKSNDYIYILLYMFFSITNNKLYYLLLFISVMI